MDRQLAWIYDVSSITSTATIAETPYRTLKVLGGNAQCMAFSPDNVTAAVGSGDFKVYLYELRSAACVQVLAAADAHRQYVEYVAFSPDGSMLASGACDSKTVVWSLGATEKIGVLEADQDASESSTVALAWSNAGDELVTAGDSEKHRHPQRWNRLGAHLGTVDGTPIRGKASAMCYSPDDAVLVSGHEDGAVTVWADDTKTVLEDGHARRVACVKFSASGAYFATSSDDQTAIIWDALGLEKKHTLRKHTREIDTIAFCADDLTLATGSRDGALIFWDVGTGKALRKLDLEQGWLTSLTFSPTWNHLMISTNFRTKIYESAIPSTEALLSIPHGWSSSYRPDGKQIVTFGQGQRQRAFCVWASSTGDLLRTVELFHNLWLNSFGMFCPVHEHKLLLTSGPHGQIIVFDVNAFDAFPTSTIVRERFQSDLEDENSGSKDFSWPQLTNVVHKFPHTLLLPIAFDTSGEKRNIIQQVVACASSESLTYAQAGELLLQVRGAGGERGESMVGVVGRGERGESMVEGGSPVPV